MKITGDNDNGNSSKLESIGLTPTDIHNLEYLEDKQVLQLLPGGFRWLNKNVREDVIIYFETFAALLEDKLQLSIEINYEELVNAVTKKQEILSFA